MFYSFFPHTKNLCTNSSHYLSKFPTHRHIYRVKLLQYNTQALMSCGWLHRYPGVHITLNILTNKLKICVSMFGMTLCCYLEKNIIYKERTATVNFTVLNMFIILFLGWQQVFEVLKLFLWIPKISQRVTLQLYIPVQVRNMKT